MLSEFEKYIILKKDKIKISSLEVKKGDVFLALQGRNFHGNKFIKSSIEKGARFCLTDKKGYLKSSKVIFVENIFSYLKKIAVKKRKLYKGKVLGITGSAGKTTLKETLAFFLKKEYSISYSKKSYNNELGIIVSLLNLNLKSNYSIFEIGTNNFGEIKYLTSIVMPTDIFITNIQSTHLKNFKSKKNIAREKSDIFIYKYNEKRKNLYLNVKNKYEKIILDKAKKEENLKIIHLETYDKKYFIKKVTKYKNYYKITLSINNKIIILKQKSYTLFRLINLLFCYAFYDKNKLNFTSINKRLKFLKPVEGRGLSHIIYINKKKIKLIDESYNANPDTMYQSIDYFKSIRKAQNKKILILGNMNELGDISYQMHYNLLNELDKTFFKFIILCGEFYKRSIKNLINPKNKFIYLENKNKIMKFLNQNVHNNDIILIKCSNSTEINKFTNCLLTKGNSL